MSGRKVRPCPGSVRAVFRIHLQVRPAFHITPPVFPNGRQQGADRPGGALMGRILGYGDVIVSTGEEKDVFKYVRNPMTFSTKINEQIDKISMSAGNDPAVV